MNYKNKFFFYKNILLFNLKTLKQQTEKKFKTIEDDL